MARASKCHLHGTHHHCISSTQSSCTLPGVSLPPLWPLHLQRGDCPSSTARRGRHRAPDEAGERRPPGQGLGGLNRHGLLCNGPVIATRRRRAVPAAGGHPTGNQGECPPVRGWMCTHVTGTTVHRPPWDGCVHQKTPCSQTPFPLFFSSFAPTSRLDTAVSPTAARPPQTLPRSTVIR